MILEPDGVLSAEQEDDKCGEKEKRWEMGEDESAFPGIDAGEGGCSPVARKGRCGRRTPACQDHCGKMR